MYEIMSNTLQVETSRIQSWIGNRRSLARFKMKFEGHFRQDAMTQTPGAISNRADYPTTDEGGQEKTSNEQDE